MIHCVGDSHVSMFNGTNEISHGANFPSGIDSLSNFKTYNIGPAIAYNMDKKEHKWAPLIDRALSAIPKTDYLLLSFGSIDCQHHLPKQKNLQIGRPYEDIIKECVDIYFQFIKNVKNLGYNNLILWGPVIVTKCECVYCNFDELCLTVKIFSDYLSELSLKEKILHIPLYKDLLRNGENIVEYYRDSLHLGNGFLPIAFSKLKEKEIQL